MGGPVVKTLPSNAGGVGSIPDQEMSADLENSAVATALGKG